MKSVYVGQVPTVKSIEKNIVVSAPAAPIAPAIPSDVVNNTATPVGKQLLFTTRHVHTYLFEKT